MTTDPDAASVAAVFDRAADVYDMAIPFFTRFGSRLVELAVVSTGEAVIDVASGRGASVIPAANAVGPSGRVLGIDLAPTMVQRLVSDLQRLGLGQASARVGDATSLDAGDEEFDVALCGFALMLMPDPAAAAGELIRVVRPGGRIALSMPTGAGPEWSFFGELIMQFAPRATRPLPSPPGAAPDLGQLLGDVGVVDVHQVDETEPFAFANTDAWWTWVWSQGMRVFLEALPDDALQELRAAADHRLQPLAGPDGSIPLQQGVRYVIGTVPSN